MKESLSEQNLRELKKKWQNIERRKESVGEKENLELTSNKNLIER